MTVQNVKIRSLGNSKLTEHPMSVSALTVLDPPTKTFSDVKVARSPTFRKKKKVKFISFIYSSIQCICIGSSQESS